MRVVHVQLVGYQALFWCVDLTMDHLRSLFKAFHRNVIFDADRSWDFGTVLWCTRFESFVSMTFLFRKLVSELRSDYTIKSLAARASTVPLTEEVEVLRHAVHQYRARIARYTEQNYQWVFLTNSSENRAVASCSFNPVSQMSLIMFRKLKHFSPSYFSSSPLWILIIFKIWRLDHKPVLVSSALKYDRRRSNLAMYVYHNI